MSLTVRYNLTLKRSETIKLLLPDLKENNLVLKSFEMKSEQKSIDIKLKGKDTIISYGEAIFYQSTFFDLSDKFMQIVEADKINVEIKNLCTVKDANSVAVTLLFNYVTHSEGVILFNNVYTQLNSEGLASILNDISKAGKHITKIVFTSPSKLSFIELTPQFETDPIWLKVVKCVSNKSNQVVMNMSDEVYDANFVSLMCHYTLTISDNIDKLGVIVYGFPQ